MSPTAPLQQGVQGVKGRQGTEATCRVVVEVGIVDVDGLSGEGAG